MAMRFGVKNSMWRVKDKDGKEYIYSHKGNEIFIRDIKFNNEKGEIYLSFIDKHRDTTVTITSEVMGLLVNGKLTTID
jgi:hypothetical protein